MQLRGIFFGFLVRLGVHNFLRKFKKKNTVTVLCFHRVDNHDDASWPPLKPEVFEHILAYIKTNYEVVFFSEIEQRLNVSNRPLLVITFDDGYYDFIQYALPLLEKYNLKSNLNIVVDSVEKGALIWTQRINNILNFALNEGVSEINLLNTTINLKGLCRENIYHFKQKIQNRIVGQDYSDIISSIVRLEQKFKLDNCGIRMMDWKDTILAKLKHVEIGSQTISHRPLIYIKDEKILTYELLGSKKAIEEKLGVDIDVFAFPNGFSNETSIKMAVDAGYRYILDVSEKFYNVDGTNTDTVKFIPRISIYHNNSNESILKIEGLHNYIKKIIR